MTSPNDSRSRDYVHAPFSDDQVASMNAYQKSGTGHPFTCGNEHCPGKDESDRTLVADRYAWHCPSCSYLQSWAHAYMADWSWKKHAAVLRAVKTFTDKEDVSDSDVAMMDHEIEQAEKKVWGPND